MTDASTADFDDGNESFSIIVIGAMNPRIHHPSWYKAIGAIDANAEKLAVSDRETLVAPEGAQFKTAMFQVVCLENRWSIESPIPAVALDFPRVIKIVFDQRLNETPISAFGINHTAHVATGHDNTGVAVVGKLNSSGLVPLDMPCDTAQYSLKAPWHEGRVQLSVAPSVKNSASLFVALNFHYTLSTQATSTYFKLSEMIADRLKRDVAASGTIRSQVIAGFLK